MTLSTTPTLEGNPIRQYLGVVTAESIVGANFVKDFMANVRDFFGGRSGAYEGVLIEARETVLKELEERASRMGANAVVGISFDYETVGASGSMLMVVASGTAVVV
ncbi:heavy metal-binding domain-containing protein [Prevotellamassilia timonensis]|uniref:heavy metal-binding domain-containing protein n=1 Tax=Prevotellamassilia timonensis TaxID=1852370 RepID=UPI001F1BCA10|nr:heavy metal-binding domain-containing protein [Prevotellamassilia timonensis]MCF2634801.1 heavy metal-binding domain-containing protein [Prevotellamassilia timonensis]